MENFSQEDKRIDLIERYHRGSLNAEEKAVVEQRLTQDADFAKEVKKYGYLLGGIDQLRAEDFKKKLGQWESNRKKENGAGPGNRRNLIFLIAAAILFLILTPFLYRQLTVPSQSAASYLAANLQDFQPDLSQRSQGDILPTDSAVIFLRQGLDLYEERNYQTAIPFLQRSLNVASNLSDQERQNATLSLGISQLRQTDYSSALATLGQVPENSVYREHSLWYRAAALILSGDPVRARPLLEELRETPYYGARAEALLELY